jgi:hypothetical protein
MLPDYLEPWTQRLNGTWPEQAGPLPDKQSFERAIKLGAGVGHVSGLAWVMYCRPDGATRKEVEAACGHTQHNRARTWQLAGKITYTKAKRPDGTTAYFIGPPGSSRGGQSAEPISDQDSPMSVDDGDVPIEPQNIVLYGPPGTGKTYATVDLTLELLDPQFLQKNKNDRQALKARFDELASTGDVRLVTFHQSFSYEDFIEGLRAERDDDGQLRYIVADGVFKNLCNAAAAKVTQQADGPIDFSGRRIWKMSLGNTLGADAYIFDECIQNKYALLGYGGDIDFKDCKSREEIVQRFAAEGQPIEHDAYAATAVSTLSSQNEGRRPSGRIGRQFKISGNWRSGRRVSQARTRIRGR